MTLTTKIVWWAARILLGLLMVLGFVTHITNVKEGAMNNSQFITAMVNTGYLWQMIGIIELLAGIAILAGRFIPLALVLLAPITLNILFFHLAHATPDGIGIAVFIVALQLVLAWLYRRYYSSLFLPNSSLADKTPILETSY